MIKTSCFLKDIGDFAIFNNVYSKHFISKSARSCVFTLVFVPCQKSNHIISLLRYSLSIHCDYYTTFSGIIIDTDGKVIGQMHKKIKQLMEEHRCTNCRLAKESNLSHFTVTKMINKNNVPTLPILEAVCKVFGITMVQFFSDDELHALTPEQQKLEVP